MTWHFNIASHIGCDIKMSCNNLHSMYMNCDSLYLIYILLCIIVITCMFSSLIRNNTMQRYTVERLAKINSTCLFMLAVL